MSYTWGGKNEKYCAILIVIFCCFGFAASAHVGQISESQARILVLTSLDQQQRRLPKLEAVADGASSSSRFSFFTVVWAGDKSGSVVVGNYAVDLMTGDVFSATRECYEENNKRLKILQTKFRRLIHLPISRYRKVKTNGPLCDR